MDILIEKTKKTPFVNFTGGSLTLQGRSIPENPTLFYRPLIEWVENYVLTPFEFTKVEINMEYINTASTKLLVDILKTLGEYYQEGNDMMVDWYYEEGDEDMLDIGLIIESIIKTPFTFIETEEVPVV